MAITAAAAVGASIIAALGGLGAVAAPVTGAAIAAGPAATAATAAGGLLGGGSLAGGAAAAGAGGSAIANDQHASRGVENAFNDASNQLQRDIANAINSIDTSHLPPELQIPHIVVD